MDRLAKISLLLFFFALCGAAVVATHFARERTPPPPGRELYSIVRGQLSALRAADFDSAYRQAATVVQQKFSRAQFELLIRRDFSTMIKAERVEFGVVRGAGSTALVQVFLTAPDRAVRGFLYSFTAETDGWKIDGVQSLGTEPVRRLRGLHI
jgi:hypothetical protein